MNLAKEATNINNQSTQNVREEVRKKHNAAERCRRTWRLFSKLLAQHAPTTPYNLE